jgi:acyl-coenzyme A thioesterase PaaI-like protein
MLSTGDICRRRRIAPRRTGPDSYSRLRQFVLINSGRTLFSRTFHVAGESFSALSILTAGMGLTYSLDYGRAFFRPRTTHIKGVFIVNDKAFQDCYAEEFSHCFGCGRLNGEGLHIKSYWDGEESVCRFTPEHHYTGGFPGSLYGGLIASLLDCHSSATAAAAKLRDQGFTLGEHPLSRFVTASIKVDYLKPTPMGVVLELRGKAIEIKDRKVIVASTLSADGVICAKGEAVMVRIPEGSQKEQEFGAGK